MILKFIPLLAFCASFKLINAFNSYYLLTCCFHSSISYFFVFVFLGKTALLRRAGQERLNIESNIVWGRNLNLIQLNEAPVSNL